MGVLNLFDPESLLLARLVIATNRSAVTAFINNLSDTFQFHHHHKKGLDINQVLTVTPDNGMSLQKSKPGYSTGSSGICLLPATDQWHRWAKFDGPCPEEKILTRHTKKSKFQ
ncbi:unnamed protein product [Dovyalis caffra]|uniref:Uncharacterized protein n=1 Tax=Dovyalis caffra TaxID=77055 RepID=A0AAV1S9P2_9ROSI|nr:unnamed protein product [Dovyalis caffra]